MERCEVVMSSGRCPGSVVASEMFSSSRQSTKKRGRPTRSKWASRKKKVCGGHEDAVDITVVEPGDNSTTPSRSAVPSTTFKSMKELLQHLDAEILTSDEASNILHVYFGNCPLALFEREMGKKKKVVRFSGVIRQFALTLYFYSPEAYEYVRTLFVLPRPKEITGYISSFRCEPGFLMEVFNFLRIQTTRKPWLRDCVLLMDSVPLAKRLQWDKCRGRYIGPVEVLGLAGEEDSLVSEALVFMIVSLRPNFKCPVAYFLVDKVDASMQAQLVSVCLSKLHEAGMKVWSVTCDGTHANMSSLMQLGCNFETHVMKCHFEHPLMGRVGAIIDPCHWMKLANRVLSDEGVLYSGRDQVKWLHVRTLDEFQATNYGFNDGACWGNQETVVQLPANVLSSRIADDIDFLRCNRTQFFEDSESTTEFIRTMDRTFNMLSSRSPFGTGHLKPLVQGMEEVWKEEFYHAVDYLKSLKIHNTPVLSHPRKMFALGCIVTLTSITRIADELLNRRDDNFTYVLTHKFSLDHLDLFVLCLRSQGSWEGHPTALQFKNSLKKLLFRNSVAASVSCVTTDFPATESVFEFRSEKRRLIGTCPRPSGQGDATNCSFVGLLDCEWLSDHQENVMFYVAGGVVLRLLPELTCEVCRKLLVGSAGTLGDHGNVLVFHPAPCRRSGAWVSQGGVAWPAGDVLHVVRCSEHVFKLHVVHRRRQSVDGMMVLAVVRAVLAAGKCPFAPSHPSTEEFGCEHGHELQLVRRIAVEYLNSRLKAYCKTCL